MTLFKRLNALCKKAKSGLKKIFKISSKVQQPIGAEQPAPKESSEPALAVECLIEETIIQTFESAVARMSESIDLIDLSEEYDLPQICLAPITVDTAITAPRQVHELPDLIWFDEDVEVLPCPAISEIPIKKEEMLEEIMPAIIEDLLLSPFARRSSPSAELFGPKELDKFFSRQEGQIAAEIYSLRQLKLVSSPTLKITRPPCHTRRPSQCSMVMADWAELIKPAKSGRRVSFSPVVTVSD